MEKINIIVPIIEPSENVLEKQKTLLKLLKKYENETKTFSLFFVLRSGLEKPKNYKKNSNSELVLSKAFTKNDLITEAFSKIEDGATIILDSDYYENILEQLLTQSSKENIVRTKCESKKENKIVLFFKKLLISGYEKYLKFFGLEKDLLCYNGFQYFNENATQIIKSMPEKNAYLRNYDALIGFEKKIVKTPLKKETVLKGKDFSVKISFISFILGCLFTISTLVLTTLILNLSNGLIFYLALIFISAMLIFLSSYMLVKIALKERANL